MVGLDEHLKFVNKPPSRVILKFHSGTHEGFEELGRHANRGTGGFQEFPNCMACKESVEHLLFECASCNSHAGTNFADRSNIYNKALFYLNEKQGMLINEECTQCSSLYNKSED